MIVLFLYPTTVNYKVQVIAAQQLCSTKQAACWYLQICHQNRKSTEARVLISQQDRCETISVIEEDLRSLRHYKLRANVEVVFMT